MSLTGIDPNDPTPSDRRELILGAGIGAGAISSRPVLLVGNKTSAGSETVDVLDASNPVADDADAQARCGKRSELYWMYKMYTAIDPAAEIYMLAVTESAGTASNVPFIVANASTTVATVEISLLGSKYYYTTAIGDTAQTTAEGIRDVINDAESGSLPFVATALVNGAGPSWDVILTASQKGPRFSSIIGSTAALGARMRFLDTNAQTITKTTGSYAAGTTEDDGTTAFASAANYEAHYWVLPWTATAAITATDNQIGEATTTIITQALPINGKEQIAIAALVGTAAQAATSATGAGANSVHLHLPWQENSEWLPGMIAAHVAAAKRSKEIAHPSANIAGYCKTDNQIWLLPPPYAVADRPTATEIRSCLNNGASPIGTRTNGATYLVRDITSKCQDSSGNADYKAREGHIYSATAFGWQLFKSRYAAQKQPFVDDNPAEGQMPSPKTTTPNDVKALMQDTIDDLCGPKPLGQYTGPILKPSQRDWMKSQVAAGKVPAGITVSAKFIAAEHNLKSETTITEVGDAY